MAVEVWVGLHAVWGGGRSSAAASDDYGHIVNAVGIGIFGGGSLLFKDFSMSPDDGDPELFLPLHVDSCLAGFGREGGLFINSRSVKSLHLGLFKLLAVWKALTEAVMFQFSHNEGTN